MGSFSGLGIGLSFVFGFILMGLVAELYYLLWWKKRVTNNNNSSSSSSSEIMEFSFLYCWKKPVSSFNSSRSTNQLTNCQEQDLENGNSSKDLSSKGYYGEASVETELMRMHNLCGPPRFLFTIKEESKEDLESDDGKSRSSRKGSRTSKSLSEILVPIDTPFLTPLSSPSVRISPKHCLDNYNNHGFNPLFESVSESEINRLRSSPPPKFKFLKDAEDKLIKRMLVEEAEKKSLKIGIAEQEEEEEKKEVSFGKFLNAKSFVKEQVHNQATQVLPLASSPTFNQMFN